MLLTRVAVLSTRVEMSIRSVTVDGKEVGKASEKRELEMKQRGWN